MKALLAFLDRNGFEVAMVGLAVLIAALTGAEIATGFYR